MSANHYDEQIVYLLDDKRAVQDWDGTVAGCQHWEIRKRGAEPDGFYECQYCQNMWTRDDWLSAVKKEKG